MPPGVPHRHDAAAYRETLTALVVRVADGLSFLHGSLRLHAPLGFNLR